MTSEGIKSGSQVISEFLDSLNGDQDIDTGTVAAVRDLFDAGKLSRPRLLNSLEPLRTDAVALATNVTLNVDEPDDD